MSERTNADIIRIVKKWQEGPLVHEMTCDVDNRHLPLQPVERDGKVVLRCPTCKWTQEHIPEAVLTAEPALDLASTMWLETAEADKRRIARQDVWWGCAFFSVVAAVLPGLVFGLPYGVLGLIAGGGASAAYARRKLRRLDEASDSRP